MLENLINITLMRTANCRNENLAKRTS